MPSANDIRRGQVVNFQSTPHLVLDMQHRTPGNLRAFVQAKMRNLKSGRSLEHRFSSTESVEVFTTDRRTLEFSYEDRGVFAFMDPETFDQIELPADLIGDSKNYLVATSTVDVLFVDNVPMTIDLPGTVSLKVIESPEGLKGDTASNVQKPAVMETGLTVHVPLFIKEGEVIKVNTSDGSYMGRA